MILLAAPAAPASAASAVRFVHAVPGAEQATLEAPGDVSLSKAFGQVSDYVELPAGPAQLTLQLGGGRAATANRELADGARYTIIALARRGDRAALRVVPDGRPRAGVARVRTIHAAPELGTVDVTVGGRETAADLRYREAGDYETFDPGTYRLEATGPQGDRALVSEPRLVVTAGEARTVFLVGSRGERVRAVSASDGTAAPPGAPATGQGGLAERGDPSRGLLIALAALAAAALGGTAYLIATARPRGPRAP